MIVFVAGTTAEVVKIAPVLHQLIKNNVPYEVWYTGMHTTHRSSIFTSMQLPEPVFIFPTPKGKDVTTAKSAITWSVGLMRVSIKQRKQLRARLLQGDKPILIVHGDTFSTVFGAVLGRWLRVPVAHVEAGLRSGSLTSPFPEEINRKVVAQLATLHFTPTVEAEQNLKRERVRGKIINTNGNTVVDNLQISSSAIVPFKISKPYGIVTLHRSELLHSVTKYKETLKILANTSHTVPLVVLSGSSDDVKLKNITDTLAFSSSVIFYKKLPHDQFKKLLLDADFVVTDSGGLQEECAALGIPCLVHRYRSERSDGLGSNVVLSEWRSEVLQQFLNNPQVYKTEATRMEGSPSEVITDTLLVFTENK